MSSQCARLDTLELVTLYYEVFNKGDRPALLRLLHPDVAHDVNQGDSEMGVDAFSIFLQRMDRCYSEQVESLTIMASDDGLRASAEFFIRGTYLSTDEGLPEATGQSYFLRVGAFFEVQKGLISRVTNYYNLTDWLLQVGAT